MIIKFQRSIEASDGVERILIYNKDHSFERLFEDPTAVASFKQHFLPNEFKFYAHVTLHNGRVFVRGRAGQQKW